MFRFSLAISSIAITLMACTPTVNYTPVEEVGLAADRPYPTAADVCVELKPTPAISSYAKSGHLLLGCPTHETGAIQDRVAEGAKVVGKVESWSILELVNDPAKRGLAAQRSLYRGKTLVYYDTDNGTQVEYFDDAGNSSLWYPLYRIASPGKVSFRKHRGQEQVCFRYKAVAADQATGDLGFNAWHDTECESLQGNLDDVVHVLEGDPFDLKSGEIPFAMHHLERVRLKNLIKRSGISVTDVRVIKR